LDYESDVGNGGEGIPLHIIMMTVSIIIIVTIFINRAMPIVGVNMTGNMRLGLTARPVTAMEEIADVPWSVQERLVNARLVLRLLLLLLLLLLLQLLMLLVLLVVVVVLSTPDCPACENKHTPHTHTHTSARLFLTWSLEGLALRSVWH
jgi:hypothetical protein